MRGLCELRPLKVCRQTPNLFPGVRHLGLIRPAADQPPTRQPKGRGSRGGTGRAEGQETLRDAATERARAAPAGAGPEKPQPRPPRAGGLSWAWDPCAAAESQAVRLCTRLPESQVNKVLLQVFDCIIHNILAQ